MTTAKQVARALIEQLPDEASWDEIMYQLYVKQKIEQGLQAVHEGRVVSHEQARDRLLPGRAR